jgi:CheY-like chemotaxis protein
MRILVAEDDENDQALMERALKKAGVTAPVRFVKDGQEVLEYLRSAGPAEGKEEQPNTLVLDIKMPRVTGLQVLEWLKGQDQFRRLPVVMFSSSDHARDVNRAYDLGANAYLVKPVAVTDYQRTINGFVNFWVELNCAPSLRD